MQLGVVEVSRLIFLLNETEKKNPFHYIRVLTRAQISAQGTDTEKSLVHVLCVCLEPK